MKTVHEVSALSGVSIRTLQYYDQIGLLRPGARSAAGYRLYGDADLERLQQILLFRELEFPLGEIKKIVGRPDFDRQTALTQQIALLSLKKERLEKLIRLACEIREKGENAMSFQAFDKSGIDAYAAEAKAQWGGTDAYREYEARTAAQSGDEIREAQDGLMRLLAGFGALKEKPVSDPEVQKQVKELQDYITARFYTCTDEILAGLGRLYAAGGDFTENIDRAGGAGTAVFAGRAIAYYCRN